MKKLFVFALGLLGLFTTQTLQAQELQEIVNKHIEAIGGIDNWKKVNSMKTLMKMKAQGAEIDITVSQVHKKGMRVDISVMGMNGYQILTDKAGWSFMPFQGQTKPEPMTAEDVKSSQDDLDLMDDFITYKDYGKKLEYLGKDEMDGTECHKISMTDPEGMMTTYFLDASNYHILKALSKKKANGKEFEVNTTFGNYTKLDSGIVVAMQQGGDMGDMEATQIVVNPVIEMSLFEPK